MKTLGRWLAKAGKGAAWLALQASQHPEVLTIVESTAKLSPRVSQIVTTGVEIAGAVQQQ